MTAVSAEILRQALVNSLKAEYGYSDKEVDAYLKGYSDCDRHHKATIVLQGTTYYEAVCSAWESCDHYAICNGTKERKLCHCGGHIEKCDFYPEKRKNKNLI